MTGNRGPWGQYRAEASPARERATVRLNPNEWEEVEAVREGRQLSVVLRELVSLGLAAKHRGAEGA